MPPWVQEGGYLEWAKRMKDPAVRERVRREMVTPTDKWENYYLAAGSPDKVLLVGFKNPKLKPLTGKTLAEVARLRGASPEDTAMDLVIEDGRVDMNQNGWATRQEVGHEFGLGGRKYTPQFWFHWIG